MGLKPYVRQAQDQTIWMTVDDIDLALALGFTHLKLWYDTSADGSFGDALSSQAKLQENVTEYVLRDATPTGRYYKAALYDGSSDGPKSDYRTYGTSCAYAASHAMRRELSASTGKAQLSPRHGHTMWEMLEEASRLIDRMRRLPDEAYAATATNTYYFDGNGEQELWLSLPLLSVTQVSVEESDGTYTDWTENTDYFAWPYNETPTLRLDVNRKSGSTKSTWIAGPRRVRVQGVFGVSSTPPEEIRRAVLIQTARWYKRATAGWADAVGSVETGELQYVRKLDPDVEALVMHAKPHELRL